MIELIKDNGPMININQNGLVWALLGSRMEVFIEVKLWTSCFMGLDVWHTLMEKFIKGTGMRGKHLAMVFSLTTKVLCTKGSGKMICTTERALKPGTTTKFAMKVTSSRARRQVLVDSTLTKTTTRVSLKTVCLMAKALITFMILTRFIMVSSKTTILLVKVLWIGQMDQNMKVNSWTERWTEKELKHGLMAICTMGCGGTISSMGKVSISIPKLMRWDLKSGEKARSGPGPNWKVPRKWNLHLEAVCQVENWKRRLGLDESF